MRPYARVRKLTEAEYQELKRSRTFAYNGRKQSAAGTYRLALVSRFTRARDRREARAASSKCAEVGQPLQQARHPRIRRRTASRTSTPILPRYLGSCALLVKLTC